MSVKKGTTTVSNEEALSSTDVDDLRAALGLSNAVDIEIVLDYNTLPSANTVANKFYWVKNSQGQKYLPGNLGGTYYPKGLYYSNGSAWNFMQTPYQATQTEVNTGTNDNKFVTPLTLRNHLSQTTFEDIYASGNVNLDLKNYNDFYFEFTGDCTFSIINEPPLEKSKVITITMNYAGTARSHTLPSNTNTILMGDDLGSDPSKIYEVTIKVSNEEG